MSTDKIIENLNIALDSSFLDITDACYVKLLKDDCYEAVQCIQTLKSLSELGRTNTERLAQSEF